MVLPIAAGAALSIGGSLVAGLLGKKKQKALPTSGFGALPPAVQEAWLNTFLPAVMEQQEKGYQARPMQRVSAPKDIFDSPELYKLQQYSDAMGGMFTPMSQKQGAKSNALTDIDKQVMAKYGMTLKDYVMSRPDVMSALGGSNPKFTQNYGTGGPDSKAAVAWWNNWGAKGY